MVLARWLPTMKTLKPSMQLTFMLKVVAIKRTLNSQNRAGKYRCKLGSSLYVNEWQHVRLQHLQREYLREILRSSAVPSDKRWMKNAWHSQSINWQRHASIQDFGAQQSRILKASWKTFSAWKTRTRHFEIKKWYDLCNQCLNSFQCKLRTSCCCTVKCERGTAQTDESWFYTFL